MEENCAARARFETLMEIQPLMEIGAALAASVAAERSHLPADIDAKAAAEQDMNRRLLAYQQMVRDTYSAMVVSARVAAGVQRESLAAPSSPGF